MALSSSTIWMKMQNGSNSLCSSAFDPSQTAGMLTDGAATVATSAAPVFTSASYSFVAGDVGARVFIAAGTNWTPGWYTIVTVDGGAATLDATAGSYGPYPFGADAATGCATVASPTGATWSIDFSLAATARFSYTDLASAGAGLTSSSAAFPLSKAYVGNSIKVASGTNYTAGTYVLASVNGSFVGTFVGAANMTTGAGASGVGYMGGAHATNANITSLHVAGNIICAKYSASVYPVVSADRLTTNGSASTTLPVMILGFDTVPGEKTPTNRPRFQWNEAPGFAKYIISTSYAIVENVIFDGKRATYATFTGAASIGIGSLYRRCKFMDCSAALGAVSVNASQVAFADCEFVNNLNGVDVGGNSPSFVGCYIHDNGIDGVIVSSTAASVTFAQCIFASNGTNGLRVASAAGVRASNCIFYANGTNGISFTAAPGCAALTNCIFESNGAYGIATSSNAYYPTVQMYGCAFYNNTTAKYHASSFKTPQIIGEIIPTASVFNAPGTGDFRLNNGAGARLKTGGWPSAIAPLTWATNQSIGVAGVRQNGGGGPFQPF